ncbi:MAG: DUF1320 domain-containing protein [Dechloromonas sp.]|nr:DUF1320 domain-containing protein [Dechloromonas sp.]
MPYATQQDLIERFREDELRQVADVDGSGDIDPAIVNRALEDAGAEIDAALLGRYLLPIAAVPKILTRIACDLARESLYTDQPTEVVTERAKQARALLSGIAKGTLRLDLPASPTEVSMSGLVEIVSGRTKSPFGG